MAAQEYHVEKGTSGCVFSPAFECQPADVRGRESTVSKIFKGVDGHRRYTLERLAIDRLELNRIDPSEDYFLYNYFECNVSQLQVELAKSKCPEFRQEGAFKALNYAKGVATLYSMAEMATETSDYVLIFIRLLNVLRGINLLHAKKRGHYDVKELNIVLHNDVYKFIDFGLSRKFKDMVFDQSYAALYRYWPIEMILLTEQHPTEATLRQHVQKYRSNPDPKMVLLNAYFDQVFQKIGHPPEDYLTAWLKTAKHPLESTDVWSFGVMLFTLYTKMPADRVKDTLAQLVMKFLHPVERLTAKEGLKLYDTFIRDIMSQPAKAVQILGQVDTTWNNLIGTLMLKPRKRPAQQQAQRVNQAQRANPV